MYASCFCFTPLYFSSLFNTGYQFIEILIFYSHPFFGFFIVFTLKHGNCKNKAGRGTLPRPRGFTYGSKIAGASKRSGRAYKPHPAQDPNYFKIKKPLRRAVFYATKLLSIKLVFFCVQQRNQPDPGPLKLKWRVSGTVGGGGDVIGVVDPGTKTSSGVLSGIDVAAAARNGKARWTAR